MRHPEYQYLDLLAQVLEHGERRVDRTGVGTLSIFGAMARFNLADGTVPILTTKRVYWKTSIKEMLWFLTGGTNVQPLLKNNVRIWTDWPLERYRKETGATISQADFEQKIIGDDAFAARWGDLGPVYGKQWRRWLGPDGKAHDQIATLIETIKTNPTSRRMLFHAWNVGGIDQMSLPPCRDFPILRSVLVRHFLMVSELYMILVADTAIRFSGSLKSRLGRSWLCKTSFPGGRESRSKTPLILS
jgi:thymidylate synthase